MTPNPIIQPAPPARLVKHMIDYLQMRKAKGGEQPPDDWMPWLEAMQQALKESETVQIEILSEADLEKFLALEW